MHPLSHNLGFCSFLGNAFIVGYSLSVAASIVMDFFMLGLCFVVWLLVSSLVNILLKKGGRTALLADSDCGIS